MKYFTFEWGKEFCKALTNNPAYNKAAATWEGDFLFICDDHPDGDVIYLYIDLWHGKCRGTEKGNENTEAEFKIRGTYDVYVQIAKKELDAIRALMEGSLDLDGDMSKIMRATKAAIELVNTITLVEGVEF
ncbi:MAG: SCP2 sterol-binding domain-containing protein [Candidatus Helarchaeota archaeon]